jgi:phosphocarrier protein
MAERTATVGSDSGLHARPAAIFAQAAAEQPLEVTIASPSTPADDALDASSVLSLMSLGAGKGDTVVLRADGDGAEQVLDDLVAVLEHNHDQP